MAKKPKDYNYTEEEIKKNRTFPKANTVILAILITVQLICCLVMIFYKPEPQDVIKSYNVYVTPKDDGSLDIEYEFTWTPLDKNEPLSWVEIGMANGNFVFSDKCSDNVKRLENDSGDGYAYAVVHSDASISAEIPFRSTRSAKAHHPRKSAKRSLLNGCGHF